MGYKICYGKEKKEKARLMPKQSLICCFLLILSLCVRLAWPEGRAYLRELLIPIGITQDAQVLVHLITRLESGSQIGDAVLVFCQELIYGPS